MARFVEINNGEYINVDCIKSFYTYMTRRNVVELKSGEKIECQKSFETLYNEITGAYIVRDLIQNTEFYDVFYKDYAVNKSEIVFSVPEFLAVCEDGNIRSCYIYDGIINFSERSQNYRGTFKNPAPSEDVTTIDEFYDYLIRSEDEKIEKKAKQKKIFKNVTGDEKVPNGV